MSNKYEFLAYAAIQALHKKHNLFLDYDPDAIHIL